MTGPLSSGCSYTSIAGFFAEKRIDAFVVAGISAITAPEGRHPRDILPSCRTIILFGVIMTDRFFTGTFREKREETKRLKELLKSIAFALKDRLESEGSPSIAILPPLPLKAEDGRIQGLLSLKHCARDAGLGTIGDITLLINPEFGNWLALAAVITEKEIEPSPHQLSMPECTRYNLCVEACPAGAIYNGFVDIMACRNLMDYIPHPLILPLVKHTLQGKRSARIMIAFLNRFGTSVGNRVSCAACVTACPYFHKGRR